MQSLVTLSYDLKWLNGSNSYLFKEFTGRARTGASFVTGTGIHDNHGHGTHVAALAAGDTYGVARRSKIVAVKVLADDGRSPWSTIISGLEWAVEDARKKQGWHKSIINMSISGDFSQAMNDAIEAAARKYCTVVVAAGNLADIADRYSPASAPNAITVGSIDRWDLISKFSNYGRFIDIFGPGSNIWSAGITSDTATANMDGTSMACPFVAGVAAYYQSQSSTKYTPYAMKNLLQQRATNNQVRNPKGSINKIVYNGGN